MLKLYRYTIYLSIMGNSISLVEFRALAEFRYLIRVFLNHGERAARAARLEPQQYLVMLMLRGLPRGGASSIGDLAERMQLRHHSVVELIDRLERQQLLRRERSRSDRRRVAVHLTRRGEKVLSRLARQRVAELRTAAPALVLAPTAVIRSKQSKASRRRASPDARSQPNRQSFKAGAFGNTIAGRQRR